MTSLALRLCASAALAGGLTFAVFAALPDELGVQTDIVGYPTFANFNIDQYFWAYGLTVAFFPLATLGLYLALTRVFVGPLGPSGPMPQPLECVEAIPVATGRREWVVAVGRTLFVGAVLGFEAAISWGQFFEFVVSTALTYVACAGLAAWLIARVARCELLDVMGSLNTLVAPLTVAALYGVSEATEVTVSPTGVVHEYPWLPAWLALGATAAILLGLGTRLRRSATRADRSNLERRALLLVVAPVGLFLFVAAMPGDLGTMDYFEEGQILAASELTRDGAFPWRDLLVTHGLLHDVGSGLFGTAVVEDSRWGVVAGESLLVEPLAWIGLYYLCTFLFGANWLFLLATQLLVVTEQIFTIQIRFLLLPFVLLLLVGLLRRATILRAATFATLLAVQVVVTPEALAAAAGYLGALFLFELYYYERGRGLGAGFRRTWLCLTTVAVLAVGWSLFLLAYGALDDWAFSFRVLIPGHRLTGGIPLRVPKDQFEVVAPVVLVLAAFGFFVVHTRLRRPFAFQDWAMVATVGLTLLYYTKFLSYADLHIYHSFSVAVPLLFYAAYRVVTFGEATLARVSRIQSAAWFPARHALTVPFLLVLLVTAPLPFHDAVRGVPGRFSVDVSREPPVKRIGYDRLGENDPRAISDVAQALDAFLEPGDTVFDFSNSPGLYHYLLDLPPGTRYYHVSLAIRQRTQTDLVRRLRENRPALVVFTSDGEGLPAWDGISNQVRHYDVSRYVLDRYVPVRDSHGFVLMALRESGAQARRELYFRVDACGWGYVPSFFSPAPAPSAEDVKLPFRRLEESPNGQRLAVTLPADAAAYGWLDIRTGEPLREGRLWLADRLETSRTGRRAISFGTLDRGETIVRVMVGACSQWRGYRPGVLYLTSDVPQDIREIRLAR